MARTTMAKQPRLVTLHDATSSKYYFKKIRLRCLLAGKGIAPFIIPREIKVEAGFDDGVQHIDKTFDEWDSILLGLINISTTQQRSLLRMLLSIPKNVPITVHVKSTMNVEELFLIPAIDDLREFDPGQYTLRQCYYIGHGLKTNMVYDFEGYTLPMPGTQHATHILVSAKPAATSIDSFSLTPNRIKDLKSTFHSTSIHEKLADIAAHFAEHVTNIYGRNDLHTAIDLVFHSPIAFSFDGMLVRKGWLEAIILGDTRTGKGFVAEGLCRHFRVGEVISGENVTVAGLIGGVQKLGDRWTLVWGKVPLNDRRLVIIDEASSLSIGDIGKLSRVRSEGVAEITKIVSESTTSRTRIIWLSNPRSTTMLGDYNYGIESIPELVGAAEDVARFDYALIVAQNEVPSDIINKRHPVRGKNPYTSSLCHDLVMWVWSRTADQVLFDSNSVTMVLKAAKELGQRFSAKIPLIQSEDIRFKIARIAAAAAARTFSTDKEAESIIVRTIHVEFAYNFLHHIYTKPCCGYAQLSEAEKQRSTLVDPNSVRDVLMAFEQPLDLIEGLLEHRVITARDLADYAGVDTYEAKILISNLVRCRAIIKEHNGYTKKAAFKPFLFDLRRKLSNEEHTTQEE